MMVMRVCCGGTGCSKAVVGNGWKMDRLEGSQPSNCLCRSVQQPDGWVPGMKVAMNMMTASASSLGSGSHAENVIRPVIGSHGIF